MELNEKDTRAVNTFMIIETNACVTKQKAILIPTELATTIVGVIVEMYKRIESLEGKKSSLDGKPF